MKVRLFCMFGIKQQINIYTKIKNAQYTYSNHVLGET